MFEALTIEKFRSVGDAISIEFANPLPKKDGIGLTVIVGPNNVGKSTILEALKFFNSETHLIDVEDRRGKDGVSTTLKLVNSQDGLELRQIQNATHVVQNWQGASSTPNYRLVRSRRHWGARNPNLGLSNDQFLSVSMSQNRDSGDSEFARRLIEIASTEERKGLAKLLNDVIPNFSEWSIERSQGQNVVMYTTHGGHEHAVDLTGDGVTSLFRLCVALLDTPDEGTCIIDEPELSLHPQAQRRLAQLIASQAETKQIIVTTHSPYFIRWQDLERGARLWRLNKYEDVQTSAHELDPKTIANLSSLAGDWQKPQMMDELAKEIFFAESVLFLEGQEDVGLFRKEIHERGLRCEFDIFGYGTGGGGNIKKYLRAANDIGVPAGALYDGDLTQEHGAAKAMFPNSKVEIAPTDDIRDKMKRDCLGGTAKCKETEEVIKAGMFTKSGSLKQAYEGDFIGLIESFNTYFANWKNP